MKALLKLLTNCINAEIQENESIREARLLVNSSQQISSYLTYLLTLPFIDFPYGW